MDLSKSSWLYRYCVNNHRGFLGEHRNVDVLDNSCSLVKEFIISTFYHFAHGLLIITGCLGLIMLGSDILLVINTWDVKVLFNLETGKTIMKWVFDPFLTVLVALAILVNCISLVILLMVTIIGIPYYLVNQLLDIIGTNRIVLLEEQMLQDEEFKKWCEELDLPVMVGWYETYLARIKPSRIKLLFESFKATFKKYCFKINIVE